MSRRFAVLLAGLAPFTLDLHQSQAGTVDIIDFETIPGATPVETMDIFDQFLLLHGVTFSLENGALPRICELGSPRVAFAGFPNDSGDDAIAPDQSIDIGQYLLTDDASIGYVSPLIIDYSTPVNACGGVLIDIDGGSTGQQGWPPGIDEAWTIEARGENDEVLDSVVLTAGDPLTGDGMITPWSFELPSDEIHSLRFVYTGTKPPGSAGFAFDNFTPSHIIDTDDDGVADPDDLCNNTPVGIPVDTDGRPIGDLDLDCDTDLVDFALFQASITGPL